MIELKSSLQLFMDRHDLPEDVDMITESDWPLLESYVKAMEPFVNASKLLAGEKYPSVCAVIPLLDQVIQFTN